MPESAYFRVAEFRKWTAGLFSFPENKWRVFSTQSQSFSPAAVRSVSFVNIAFGCSVYIRRNLGELLIFGKQISH
jgi:hypothetical protein